MDEYDDMWSDLGEDLLGTICEALTIPDIYSFASVCRSWRSAAALNDKRRHLLRFKLQKPWLVFSESNTETCTSANFYSISDGRFFAMGKEPDASTTLPSLNNCFVIGSDHGWMIVADERSELSLVNPMTRKQIALPPVSTLDIVRPEYGDDNIITSYRVNETGYYFGEGRYSSSDFDYTVENLRYSLYWKACLSSSPASSDDDYTVVVLLHNQLGGLMFAKSGDEKWTTMFDVLKPLFIVDMIFHHHSNRASNSEVVLLTTNGRGMIQELDLSNNAEVMKREEFLPVPELDWKDYFFYLAHATWGDLLYVRRLRGYNRVREIVTSKIEVYRVDFIPGSQKSRRLVKVESLGDHALFLGGNTPVCVSTVDAPGLKPNCVYFTDEYSDYFQVDYFDEKRNKRDIGIYNLKDGTIEPILPDDNRLYWPPPLWFTPSLL